MFGLRRKARPIQIRLWQLTSIARGGGDLLSRIAESREDWRKYVELMRDYSGLVARQDRASLDTIVDIDFAEAVLGQVDQHLFLSPDRWLRSHHAGHRDETLSMLEAFRRYGGEVVEDALEYGSVRVPKGRGG
ncbi:MAG: hypothetical protein JWP35_3461 [Caulobacter sp.]|nr:hypothetical protein [Caulobacter sp.]